MRLTEALALLAPPALVPLRESGFLDYDYADPDLNLPATGGGAPYYRRLSQQAGDLSPLTQDRMMGHAMSLADRNPLGRGIVRLITAFVVGEGITVSSKDEEVQAAIDRFWEDGRNDWERRAADYCRELSIYGEQLLLAFVNESSGRVAVAAGDPRAIKSVLKDPQGGDHDYAVCVAGPAGMDDRWLKVISEDDDPQSETFGKLVGTREGDGFKLGDQAFTFWEPQNMPPGVRLAGCFFTAVNRPRTATRGRSDLLPVIDFIDLYDHLLFDEAERMSFLRAFVWDVKVDGATEAQLQAKAQREPVPKPGSVKYHNESEEWKPLSPQLNSQDSQNTADLILSLIATGVGLPKHWLNGIMDVNRATAGEMGDPAIKQLTDRQKLVIGELRRVVRFALDQAELAGALKPADDERHHFEVSAPEMSSRDLEKAARALGNTVQALGMADAANWIDDETAQQALVLFLGQLGITVDLQELRERIEAQQAADADDYEYPEFLGAGKRPGQDNLTGRIGNGDEDEGRGGRPDGAAPGRPALAPADAKTAADVLEKTAGAMAALGQNDLIDQGTALEVVSNLLAAFGVQVTADELAERIEDENEAEEEEELPDETDEIPAEGDEEGGELLDEFPLAEAALTEAWDEGKHPRGPGGKFAAKAGDGADLRTPEGVQPGRERLAAMLAKALGGGKKAGAKKGGKGKAAKGKAKKGRAGAKGRKGRASKAKALTATALRSKLGNLKDGDKLTITVNGPEGPVAVKATVALARGGAAVVRRSDGRHIVLHSGMKNIASIEGG